MDEMKTCSACGSPSPGDALFCMKCGASLGAAGSPAVVAAPPPPSVPYGPMQRPGVTPGPMPPPGMPHPGMPPPPGMHAAGPPPPPGSLPPGFVAMPRPLPNNEMAIVSLVLSIAGLVTCLIFLGIPAVIFGHLAMKNIRESAGTMGGDAFAMAGLIIGWIEIGLMVLFIIIMIIAAATGNSNAMIGLI